MGIDHAQTWVFSHCLEGQVALVTGAGRGLGRGCALVLAAAGADLILLGRHTETLEEVAREVERLGKHALPIVCDITQPAQVTQTFHVLGQLDIVVNQAILER
jgi:NAD(P)-dependent dehydrogenase (short-subunit alcohol dehydrogenase family)